MDARLDNKFRLLLPKEFREALGLKPGESLEIKVDEMKWDGKKRSIGLRLEFDNEEKKVRTIFD